MESRVTHKIYEEHRRNHYCRALSLWSLGLQAWQPAQGPLQTRWTREVSPQNDHPEYPRPQLVRKEWLNLNGVWGFEMTTNNAQPTVFPQEILVPFPVESALSGVMKPVSENDRVLVPATPLIFRAVGWPPDLVELRGSRLRNHCVR